MPVYKTIRLLTNSTGLQYIIKLDRLHNLSLAKVKNYKINNFFRPLINLFLRIFFDILTINFSSPVHPASYRMGIGNFFKLIPWILRPLTPFPLNKLLPRPYIEPFKYKAQKRLAVRQFISGGSKLIHFVVCRATTRAFLFSWRQEMRA